MKWPGCVAHMADIRNAYNISVGKSERKRSSYSGGLY